MIIKIERNQWNCEEKIIEKTNETNPWFLEKINKIDKAITRLTRKKKIFNKSDRERQILYDIIYMWNLKNTTN